MDFSSQQKHFDSSLFPSTCFPRGAGETASHPAAQVHHEVKGVERAGTAVWAHHCPAALPGHEQGAFSHPELPQDGLNTSCFNPAGTHGPRRVGWKETWKEGKTPESGTV